MKSVWTDTWLCLLSFIKIFLEDLAFPDDTDIKEMWNNNDKASVRVKHTKVYFERRECNIGALWHCDSLRLSINLKDSPWWLVLSITRRKNILWNFFARCHSFPCISMKKPISNTHERQFRFLDDLRSGCKPTRSILHYNPQFVFAKFQTKRRYENISISTSIN